VLLSAAEKSHSHPFSICFVCVFPLFCPDIIVFSSIFDGFLRYFLASFSPFSAVTLQKVRKNSEMSIAEKCNPQPFSICFAEVFLVFAMVFDGFWSKTEHFNSIPNVFPQFFDGFLRYFLDSFSIFTMGLRKVRKTLKLVAD